MLVVTLCDFAGKELASQAYTLRLTSDEFYWHSGWILFNNPWIPMENIPGKRKAYNCPGGDYFVFTLACPD